MTTETLQLTGGDMVQDGDFVCTIIGEGRTWGPGGPSPAWQVEAAFPTPADSPSYRRQRSGYARVLFTDGSMADIPHDATVWVVRP